MISGKKPANRIMSAALCFFIIFSCAFVIPQTVQAASSDATLSSSVYTIDSSANTIKGVPYADRTFDVFKSKISVPAGASFKAYRDVENDAKTEILDGDIVSGNEIVVTAEDGVTKRTYTVFIDEQNNAEIQFSHIQGYNNWYYREYYNGQLKDMVWTSRNGFSTWMGSAEFSIMWKDMLHPDTNSQPSRVFKAPRSGIVAIDSTIRRMNQSSNGVRVKVLKNSSVVWPETGEWVTLADSSTLTVHKENVTVQKGDEISFVLDNNGNSAADTTYWLALVTYMPEVKVLTALSVSGDDSVQIPVSGNASYKFDAAALDQNGQAMAGENVNWSINTTGTGISVDASGLVNVESTASAEEFNLVAASVSNPQISMTKTVILIPASQKIYSNTSKKLLAFNLPNMSMLIDYNNKVKIASLKVKGVETLDAEGITTSVEAPRGQASIGTANMATPSSLVINGDTAALNDIVYANNDLSVSEKWLFTVNDEDVDWRIERTFNTTGSAVNVSIEQKTAGFTFKKDAFDSAFRSDGGSNILLSPSNRSTIRAFDPYDKVYGTAEAGVAYEGGGVELLNVPSQFILSLNCTSSGLHIASEFYRDPVSLALKYDNKLNTKAFAHTLHRPEYDLGFHYFQPAYNQHSYDPVEVANAQVDVQEYKIKAYPSTDKYYNFGTLPQTSGIDQYKLSRFLSEFGRTSVTDLNGIGGSWNALYTEFADTMAGQYAVNLMNGMQYSSGNSVAEKALKALVEAGIRTQKSNGHMVGCPEISGQANNYENVSEADAALPMDAAAYINATGDVQWAAQVKDAIRKALDYRLSKDANNNGLVENEIDNNYGTRNQAWLDVLYIGGEDAYVNALMYSALIEWADIEEKVFNDSEKAGYYREKASRLKETYNKDLQDGGFWSDSYQSFIGWRFLDGSVKADVKYLHVSATAIAYGVASKEHAKDFLYGSFDGYTDIEDWMVKNSAKAYPLNLESLDKTEIMERFLNEWPGWENGQIFPHTTGDMMAAYARTGSTLPVKYMKNLVDFYYQPGDTMYYFDTYKWDFGTDTYNCKYRMAINVYSAAVLFTDVFGFKPRLDGLEVNPVLDESLYGSEINYNMRGHQYRVRFDNANTRTMLVNDGVEKVTFKWNNLVPGALYNIVDETTQQTASVTADDKGIASYSFQNGGIHKITISGDSPVPVNDTNTFKATSGYSGSQDTGNWLYEEINGSARTPLQWNAAARQWENADKSSVIDCRSMKSGSGKQVSRTFKAPRDGDIEIFGNIRLKETGTTGSNVRITKNGNAWWPAAGSQSIKSTLGIGFKGMMKVAKGDLVQFTAEGAETVIFAPKLTYIDNYTGNDSFEVKAMPSYTKELAEYDAVKSFAFTQGIDNWYYEERVNGEQRPMHWASDKNAWQGSAEFALIGADWMHPENGIEPVRVFKAPKSGQILVTGAVSRLSMQSDGVKVGITRNGVVVWPADGQLKLLENLTPVDINEKLDVEEGDRIGFILNCNATAQNDTTSWAPNIKYLQFYYNSYDSISGFSNEQGKNNWYYREYVNGVEKNMTWNGGWNAWQGSTQFALVWDKVMHPGYENGEAHDSARIFKVPKKGIITVTGSVSKDNSNGNGTNVQIRKNGTAVWPAAGGWQLITGTAVDTGIELQVEAGDELAFVVNCNGNDTNSDATNWAPVITYKVPVTGISLDKTEATLKEGTTLQLTAAVAPLNATNKQVIWTSSREETATVDANGLVTAVKAGKSAVITARTADGSYQATCSVTVTKKAPNTNKSVLIAKIQSASALNKSAYTSATWAVLENALAAAMAANADEQATQNEVDKALRELDTAINRLKPVNTDNTNNGNTNTGTDNGNTNTSSDSGNKDTGATSTNSANGERITVKKFELDTVGDARASIDKDTIRQAFGQAAGNGKTKEISIAVPVIPGAKTYTVELPFESVSAAGSSSVVNISTPAGDIAVPGNMFGNSGTGVRSNAGISMGMADTSALNRDIREIIGNRPVVELSARIDGKPAAWNNPDAPVTVSVDYKPTAEELKDYEHILVWYIDGTGNLIPVLNAKYNPQTGKVTFTVTHFSKYAVGYMHKKYNDTGSCKWAEKQIEFLASRGIINGTSDTGYSPQKSITRADFITWLVRATGLTTSFDANFSDVKKGDAYYEAAGIAKKLGIMAGTGDNRLNPEAQISRQDMMVIVAKLLKVTGKSVKTGTAEDVKKFNDAAKISGYAAEHAAILIGEGIIEGSGDKINPLSNFTRAEAAVLIYKVYNTYFNK